MQEIFKHQYTMRKLLLAGVLTVQAGFLFAQEDKGKTEKKEGWKGSGTFQVLFNQAAFNAEWQGGGSSNYAGNISISYDLNYSKGRLTWDNKFLGDYGMTKIKDEDWSRKTNDRLELNSVVGYKLNKETKWSYSFFLNFRTQFAQGYEYDDTYPDGRKKYTEFMSPGYLQFGPGMLWKDSENLKVNVSPATARMIFVSDRFTGENNVLTGDPYIDGDYFGIDKGETFRFEFGASVSGYYKFKVADNVTMENMLALYSNYLDKPQNIDLNYTMNLNMKVNKHLSANFIFQTIYDDNAVSGFQVREVLGVGFNYAL